MRYLPVEASDYQRITEIMTVAFDDDTKMQTDLLADGPPDYSQRNCYFYQYKCSFSIVGERIFSGGTKAVILQKQKATLTI